MTTEPTSIRLPSTTLHTRPIVDKCEWRIRRFVEYDAYVPYDHWITTLGLPDAIVTRQHLRAINDAMHARAGVEPWKSLLDQPVPELARIPPELDLVSSPDQDVERGLRALVGLCRRISSRPYVTDMAMSKVFHLIRPRFVPISDTYVRLCLGIRDEDWIGARDRGTFYAARLECVARGKRELGERNREALERLKQLANGLPPVVPARGKLRGLQIPVRLSTLRILDIVLWTEVAIHGRTPHAEWLAADQAAFGEPAGGGPPNANVTRATTPPQPMRERPDSQSILPNVPGVVVFRDNDVGYIEWLRAHPRGLVLNCERSPRAAYLKLHRATCGTINGQPAQGKSWTGPYLKACAESSDQLRRWAALATGGELQPCGICRP